MAGTNQPPSVFAGHFSKHMFMAPEPCISVTKQRFLIGKFEIIDPSQWLIRYLFCNMAFLSYK